MPYVRGELLNANGPLLRFFIAGGVTPEGADGI